MKNEEWDKYPLVRDWMFRDPEYYRNLHQFSKGLVEAWDKQDETLMWYIFADKLFLNIVKAIALYQIHKGNK